MIEIAIKARKNRDEKRQNIYVDITKNGEIIPLLIGNVPASLMNDSDILTHLGSRKDELLLVILRKFYPEADPDSITQEENVTDLEKMQTWITNGCKNKIVIGETKAGKPKFGYEIIEKQPWTYKHPSWINAEAEIEKASITLDLKTLLKKVIMR